jgi:hypothetical protein
MTEVEQLRKELNELRERIVNLENSKYNVPAYAPPLVYPANPYANPFQPPYVVTCTTDSVD